MNASWYAVKNVTDDEAEISIYDEIGLFGISAKNFVKELKSLGDRRINLRIHSPGGEIFDGNAIYNALRRHPGGVDVQIDGLAASMATVIAMAGINRRMAANAMFMIHNPWGGAFGESSDMRKTADLLDDLKQNIISSYAGVTGMDRDELSQMMDEETWLTAQEAKDYGFITEITEPMELAAKFERFDMKRFSKTPARLMAKPKNEDKPTTEPAVETPVETPVVENETPAPAETEQDQEQINARLEMIAEHPNLKAEVTKLKAELVARDATICNLTESLSAKTALYDNLKKSLGINPASEIPVIPAQAAATGAQLLDQYNSITDPAERTRFWKQHKDAIKAAQAEQN